MITRQDRTHLHRRNWCSPPGICSSRGTGLLALLPISLRRFARALWTLAYAQGSNIVHALLSRVALVIPCRVRLNDLISAPLHELDLIFLTQPMNSSPVDQSWQSFVDL